MKVWRSEPLLSHWTWTEPWFSLIQTQTTSSGQSAVWYGSWTAGVFTPATLVQIKLKSPNVWTKRGPEECLNLVQMQQMGDVFNISTTGFIFFLLISSWWWLFAMKCCHQLAKTVGRKLLMTSMRSHRGPWHEKFWGGRQSCGPRTPILNLSFSFSKLSKLSHSSCRETAWANQQWWD